MRLTLIILFIICISISAFLGILSSMEYSTYENFWLFKLKIFDLKGWLENTYHFSQMTEVEFKLQTQLFLLYAVVNIIAIKPLSYLKEYLE